jgi:hypothetical protein
VHGGRLLPPRAALRRAEDHQRLARRDAAQDARRVAGAQVELALEHAQEGLLRRVQREGIVAQHAQGGAVHRRVVLAHEPLERGRVDRRIHAFRGRLRRAPGAAAPPMQAPPRS